MPERAGITCRGVTRTYRAPGGSVEALHAVDADFPSGAVCAVVGPSGCGKSTLLRLLAGIDAADGGTIAACGIDVTRLDGSGLRRYRRDTAAFLAQRAAANLVPHLTVAEQLGDEDGTAVARELGLEPRLHARAGELSGGEQARAALAVGLSRGTPLFLVDEPTAELDRAAADHVIGVLHGAAERGRCVVVATHDPDLVKVAHTTVELTPPRVELPQAAHSARVRSGDAPAVAFQAVTKAYGKQRVVDGASLELYPGELGVLLGRSGSGKSTLLMAAGGWVAPDAGTIAVPGGRRGAAPPWRDTSYLAQRFGLLAELSAAENVALPSRLAGEEGDVRALLASLALEGVASRSPLEASVGQQQRIALARALAIRPRALLADEPTSHQDVGSAELVWRALASACAEGTACLVATHDGAAAERADRLWRIEDGRVRAVA